MTYDLFPDWPAERCRLHNRGGIRCENKAIEPDLGLCAHHLAEAVRIFRELTGNRLSITATGRPLTGARS